MTGSVNGVNSNDFLSFASKNRERKGEGRVQEREYAVDDYSLYYEIIQEGPGDPGRSVCVTRFQGQAGEVAVPALVEGLPVTGIGKKAFLSRKNLYRVILPDTLEEIGDWAFAYCSGLKRVELPGRKIHFGRSVFLECGSLEQIAAGAYEEGRGDFSRLLAAAVTMLDAPYLLDIQEAGMAPWLAKWDAKLVQVLQAPDQEGYSRQVLCGEEDYGSTDLAAYLSGRRKEKIRLCYLRLLHPQGLSRELQEELEGYLCAHTKGRESSESWQVLLEEHAAEREYYRLFARLGCVDAGNLPGILEDIGDAHPEMKAFFLTWKGEMQEKKPVAPDFFADFEL